MDIPTLEIKKSSMMQIKTKHNAMGLMSESYTKGIYHTAENVNCTITFEKHASEKQKEIEFLLYDFAAFAMSTEFCLSVKDYMTPQFCSSSKDYYTHYGPFNMTNKRQLSFTLSNIATGPTQAPEIRFWFSIYVSNNDVFLDHLECHSKPVAAGTVITVSVVLGFFLLIVVVAYSTGAICWCRMKKSCCSSKNSDGSDSYADITEYENTYNYIDPASMDSAEGENRTAAIIQDNLEDRMRHSIPSVSLLNLGLGVVTAASSRTTLEQEDKQEECSVSIQTAAQCTSDGPNDYIEPIGNPCARSAMIQVHSEQEQLEASDDTHVKVDEYTSLNTTPASDGSARNDLGDQHTLLGNRESNRARNEHEGQQEDRDTSYVNVNEYTSLDTTPVSGGSARSDLGNPCTLLGNSEFDQARNEHEVVEEGHTSQEPHDYLELIGDPMELEQ